MARNQWNQTHVPFKDWGQIVATLCCAKGETREVLREKHGEEPAKLDVRHDPWMSDEAVQLAATEDANDGKGWLSEPTIGLSDFACLYGNQEEEAEDEGFSAQVAEARQHLEAADEKLQAKQKAKEDAEAPECGIG
ncbi:unnamed protein product [Cladocopium goreaui]|uniref:Uncharacterized protein n=1 Tax=Cladocopium goreaui TaxID=2562237 RepID=A0A9P1G0Z8_9DINO|nr:unnamed protein product [Cladocopium goreaui]